MLAQVQHQLQYQVQQMKARFGDRLNALPKLQTEDSVALRLLVQMLVTVGIIATDIAAGDVTDRLNLIAWAVPLSFIGAAVSYFRRDKRNIVLKFGIALGMLVALAYFFGNLLSRSNDTRLVLVELLIQLQVLHSFDLPRRKDLGYSMMIGLILVASAATLSQTLLFGPFLFLFLALALPILVLDYCSRLGFTTGSSFGASSNPADGRATAAGSSASIWSSFNLLKLAPDLAPRRIGVVLLCVTALGLAVFASLPRTPGYQFRTFPVSAPINVQGEFDNRQIFNPGYIAGGEGEGGGGEADPNASGRGQSPTTGPGETDEEFYYGFNSQMNQNLRGSLTPRTVMRVRSQIEGFWRVLAFDRYTGQGWEVSRNDDTETLRRSSWSYRFNIPAFVRGRTQEVIQTYTMTSDLPNLVPALHQATQVYFPTEEIAIDTEGGLRAPIPLTEGLTYTIVSQVPFRDRAQLAAAGQDYPKTLGQRYFELPEAIAPKLRAKAEELLAQASTPIRSPYEQALFLTQALKQRYQIQPELPFLDESEDLAEAFLFKYQGGYPDHFSTTLTLMLRSIGLPARLAVGFGPGDFNPFTGFYIVSNTDAYAITEVYFPEFGWFAFDPIPGHPLIPPSVEESDRFGVLKRFWQWVAGWLPSPVRNVFNQVFGFLGRTLGGLVGGLLGLLARDVVGLFTGLILVVGLAFLGWLGWEQWRRWRYRRWLAKLPPVESLYQQLLAELERRGYPKQPTQTPYEYLEAVRSRTTQANREAGANSELRSRVNSGASSGAKPGGNLSGDLSGDSREIQTATAVSEAYVRWRYGGENGGGGENGEQDLQALQQSLREMRSARQQSLWQRLRT